MPAVPRGHIRDAINSCLASSDGWTALEDIYKEVQTHIPGVKQSSIRSFLNDNKLGGRKRSDMYEYQPRGFYRFRNKE